MLDALQWIGIILLAGFIGYFGKHAAKMIIAKCSKKKEEKNKDSTDKKEPVSKNEYKLEKKRLKAESKKK